MKNFSLFRNGIKALPALRADLGKVSSLSRRDFNDRESFVFQADAPSIEYACLMIGNALLLRTKRSGRIYAGFEKFSLMQPVADLYLRIADISETMYIFGEDDWRPPRHPNIRYVPLLAGSNLSRETFVVSDCSTYYAALVAVNQDRVEGAKPEHRKFMALKSSDPVVVRALGVAVEGMIDWSYAA